MATNAVWRDCPGEAHRNPHIDHCGICMPYWLVYPACPECGDKIVGKRGRSVQQKQQKVCCGQLVRVDREERP